MEDRPAFRTGDRVRERIPGTAQTTATIIDVYKFEDRYRYIVRFDDGRTHVFFGYDLIPLERSAG
jgi:hypothetical protein